MSSAVLKLNDQVDRYRVGESLANSGFQLAEVYWDRVILRRSTWCDSGSLLQGSGKWLKSAVGRVTIRILRSMPACLGVGQWNQPINEQPSPQNEIGRAIQQMQENRAAQYLENMGVCAG